MGVGPSKDHKTDFFLEMASLSLTDADVRDLDDSGGSGHGLLPNAAGDSYPCRPRHKIHKWVLKRMYYSCNISFLLSALSPTLAILLQ